MFIYSHNFFPFHFCVYGYSHINWLNGEQINVIGDKKNQIIIIIFQYSTNKFS